jgi:hypothetical protein
MMLKAGVRTGKQQVPPLRDARSKNIPKREHQQRNLSTTLRFGRDDKGEGNASKEGSFRTETDFHNCVWAHPDRSVAERRDLLFAGSYADRVELCES